VVRGFLTTLQELLQPASPASSHIALTSPPAVFFAPSLTSGRPLDAWKPSTRKNILLKICMLKAGRGETRVQ